MLVPAIEKINDAGGISDDIPPAVWGYIRSISDCSGIRADIPLGHTKYHSASPRSIWMCPRRRQTRQGGFITLGIFTIATSDM